jgi:tetratricopeptide (TPR) repeat protein
MISLPDRRRSRRAERPSGAASADASLDDKQHAAVPPRRGWRELAAPLVLALLGVVCYSNSFTGPFVYDGIPYIVDNPSLRQLCPWKLTLGRSRPVSYYSFALNYAANERLYAPGGGYDVWAFHATNLAIHVLAGLALYGLVWRTLAGSARFGFRYAEVGNGLALAVAAIWLVHPLQTQSVTYIYQRQESLMGLFYLATLYCVVRGIEGSAGQLAGGTRPAGGTLSGRWWFVGAVTCCALGMGTKEVMISAPLVALWYDRAFWAKSWRALWARRKGLYLGLFGTWAILAYLMIANRAAYTEARLLDIAGLTPWQYARSQPGVICHYLALCFWPAGLCLDYGWPVAQTAVQIVPPALVLAALALATMIGSVRYPAWGFLGGCFFLILAPTSSIAPVADLAFDHRMYLPLAAVVAAVVLVGYEIWQRWSRSTQLVQSAGARRWLPPATIGAVVVLLLGAATYRRNEDYRTAAAIWQDTVKKRPDNLRAYVWLSSAELEEGDFDRARGVIEQALQRGIPVADDPQRFAKLYYNRGRANQEQGRFAAAIDDYGQAIALDPKHADAYNNRAMLFGRQGRWDDAIADFLAAEKLAPDYAGLYNNCGVTYRNAGRLAEAIEQLTKAIELDPTAAVPRLNRAICYAKLGRPDLARSDASEYERLGGPPDGRAKEILNGSK